MQNRLPLNGQDVYATFQFMADNVQSAMLETLKRVQSDLAEVKGHVAQLRSDMADVKPHLERVEDIVTKQRRDSAAMLIMMRATVGVFNERVGKLETDVQVLKDNQ